MSENPRQKNGRGLVDRKQVESPSNFIAGRPKAALIFWFLMVRLWYAGISATSIAAHIAVSDVLKKKTSENR